MQRSKLAAQSRARLDERFRHFGSAKNYTPPVRGWIRAIREALGMTAEQLARRLQATQPAIVKMEASESKGTIQLATLRRAAAALDCDLVYALVPRKPLEETIRARARNLIRQRRAPVEHSMLLEDQKASSKNEEASVDEVIRETNPSLFWR